MTVPGLSSKRDGALIFGCLVLVAFGVWLRVQQLAHPAQLTFDEHHFVKNAQNYLAGRADWNDHPPLGKLLIAGGIRLFGDNSLGWRAAPCALGVLSIGLAYLIAARLFADRRAGLLAAALIAIDGFWISYSRTALLDGMLACFVLAIAAVLVRARRPWHIALAAVLIGLGCAVKFSVITLVVPAVALSLVLGRAPRWSVVGLALAPVSYTSVYAYGLALSHKPWGPAAVLADTARLWKHHAALTDGTHPLISKWYTWLLPRRPFLLRLEDVGDGWVRPMTSLGNPLLWWAASAAVLVGLVWVSQIGLQRTLTRMKRRPLPPPPADFQPVAWLLAFWALPVVPWILSRRDSYIYHYLPAYGFAVVLVAGLIARVIQRRAVIGLTLLLVLAEVSVFYAPVWGQLRVTRAGYEQRLFFPGWR